VSVGKRVERVHLKKQSQFAPARMGAKSYVKGEYGKKPARGAEENKANLPAFGRKS